MSHRSCHKGLQSQQCPNDSLLTPQPIPSKSYTPLSTVIITHQIVSNPQALSFTLPTLPIMTPNLLLIEPRTKTTKQVSCASRQAILQPGAVSRFRAVISFDEGWVFSEIARGGLVVYRGRTDAERGWRGKGGGLKDWGGGEESLRNWAVWGLRCWGGYDEGDWVSGGFMEKMRLP